MFGRLLNCVLAFRPYQYGCPIPQPIEEVSILSMLGTVSYFKSFLKVAGKPFKIRFPCFSLEVLAALSKFFK